jgi:UDP-glucose 4-epimerase
MRVFITGDQGFIAQHVARALDNAGHSFFGCDIATGIALQDLRWIDADVVVHLAAIACARHPDDHDVWRQNLGATAALLESFDGHVVFASTAAAKEPLSSAYAGAKYAAEQLVLAEGGTVLRFANVYGPGQRDTGYEPGVLAAWAKASRDGEPLRVDGDGTQTRDFIHVSDVARAVVSAAERRPGGTIDICTGAQVSVQNAVDRLYPHCELIRGERAPSDPDCILQDPIPAEEILGFKATHDLLASDL